jgi:TonB family protein
MLGREGVVVLLVTVDDRGGVRDVEVRESSGGGFEGAAREAARGARFRPAERGGQHVASTVTLRVRFRLE